MYNRTAQHSTALTTLLFFSDKRLSVIFYILGMIVMRRSIRLLFCMAFFIFAAKKQLVKVSERDFEILGSLSLFFILEEF